MTITQTSNPSVYFRCGIKSVVIEQINWLYGDVSFYTYSEDHFEEKVRNDLEINGVRPAYFRIKLKTNAIKE